MITPEQQAASQTKRIEILREGYGSEHSEVKAWDAEHPVTGEPETGSADRLTDEEVAAAVETVPAAGVAKGKIGGRKALDDSGS